MAASVRLARDGEAALLPPIEASASKTFRGSAHDAIADGEVSPDWFYAPLIAAGRVWVADADGRLVGFAATQAFDDALHVWELAVTHDHQRRGVGRALLAKVAEAARAEGLPSVTLTTFTNIPWNAPFYARLGFRQLTESDLCERLSQTLAKESGRGLTDRCAMRLTL